MLRQMYFSNGCRGVGMVRCAAVVILISAVLVASGCYPEFVEPINPAKSRRMDEDVLGNWVRRVGIREVQQVSFFPRELSDWVDIVFVYAIDLRARHDGARVEVFQGYTTRIDGVNYLCFRRRFKDYPDVPPREFRYYIAAWEVEGAVLIIKMLSLERIAELIEDGDLVGEAVVRRIGDDFYDSIVVASPGEVVTEVIDDAGIDDLSEEDALHTIVFYREIDKWRRY